MQIQSGPSWEVSRALWLLAEESPPLPALEQSWKKSAGIVLRRLELLWSIIKKIRLIKITFRIMTKLGGGGGKRV